MISQQLIVVTLLVLAIHQTYSVEKTCGELPYVDNLQDFVDAVSDNKQLGDAFADWKESSPVAKDGELGPCEATFQDATNVCCQKGIRGHFKAALAHIFHKFKFNPKKNGCAQNVQMMVKTMRSCKLEIPEELDGETIKEKFREKEKDIRKAVAKSIIETIRFLRGNLCLLCVDPNDDVTLAKFWDGEKILINKDGFDKFLDGKASALDEIDDLNSVCTEALEKGMEKIAEDEKCAKKQAKMLEQMEKMKSQKENQKESIQADQTAFGLGRPAGDLGDPDKEGHDMGGMRFLDEVVGDMKIVDNGGLETYVEDKQFDDGEIEHEGNMTTMDDDMSSGLVLRPFAFLALFAVSIAVFLA